MDSIENSAVVEGLMTWWFSAIIQFQVSRRAWWKYSSLRYSAVTEHALINFLHIIYVYHPQKYEMNTTTVKW